MLKAILPARLEANSVILRSAKATLKPVLGSTSSLSDLMYYIVES
jgi:hypothetical protein